MRLGFVVSGSLDDQTEPSRYCCQLVDHLRAAGDDVSVFPVPAQRPPSVLTNNVGRSLFRRIRAADVDVLVEDERCHPSLVWLNRRLRRRLDLPLVALVDTLRSAEPRQSWWNGGHRRVEQAYLQRVDGFIYTSEWARRAVGLLADPNPSVVASPAGDRFDHSLTPDAVRTRAQEGPLGVVVVGAVTPRSGLQTLVDGLERTTGDWTLTIVGDDTIAPEYTKYLSHRVTALGVAGSVTITGPLSQTELATLFERSHVLAVPATDGGLGVTPVEAMGFGLPVVTSLTSGAVELVTDRVNGLLIEPDDASAVTDALAPLCRNRDRLAKLSVAALETAQSQPTWTETTTAVRQFIQRSVLVQSTI